MASELNLNCTGGGLEWAGLKSHVSRPVTSLPANTPLIFEPGISNHFDVLLEPKLPAIF